MVEVHVEASGTTRDGKTFRTVSAFHAHAVDMWAVELLKATIDWMLIQMRRAAVATSSMHWHAKTLELPNV